MTVAGGAADLPQLVHLLSVDEEGDQRLLGLDHDGQGGPLGGLDHRRRRVDIHPSESGDGLEMEDTVGLGVEAVVGDLVVHAVVLREDSGIAFGRRPGEESRFDREVAREIQVFDRRRLGVRGFRLPRDHAHAVLVGRDLHVVQLEAAALHDVQAGASLILVEGPRGHGLGVRQEGQVEGRGDRPDLSQRNLEPAEVRLEVELLPRHLSGRREGRGLDGEVRIVDPAERADVLERDALFAVLGLDRERVRRGGSEELRAVDEGDR